MKKELYLKWINNGKEYVKEIDRKKFYDLMDSIKQAFSYDNRVSTFFCQIIPEVEWIEINKDRNEELDVPFVEYEVNGQRHLLEIIRHHKIIWSVLEGYTK